MMSGKLNKLLLIFILLFSFCVSIGYSALNASLSVTGDLVYRVPADIRITGVKISSVTNGGLEQYSPKYTKDTASVGLKLPNLDSTVVYEVTVQNTSSQRKRISAITNKVVGNTSISYTYDYKLNTAIAATSSIKILFTYKYSGVTSLPSNTLKENTISLTFTDAYPLLYDRVQTLSSDSSNYIKQYTGDTSTFKGNKSVYYYYEAAKNNNALFANYCWKIVRTTDTGGVKLLYNGVPSSGKCNNTGDASQLTAAQMNLSSNKIAFNSNSGSPADVGYMFNTRYEQNSHKLCCTGNDCDLEEEVEVPDDTPPLSSTTKPSLHLLKANNVTNDLELEDVSPKIYSLAYTCITNKYIFGNSFTYNASTKTYTLSGTRKTITDWSTDYNTLSNTHYTCWNTTGTCSTLYYVYYTSEMDAYSIKLVDGTSVAKALEEMFSSGDVNNKNSTIKTAIDYWYSKNMTIYTSYLEDTVWCNDRSISDYGGWNPNGGSMTEFLKFNSYGNKSDLTCSNKNDRFTVNDTNGNKSLTYPVGLITRQEQNLAYVPYVPQRSPLVSGNLYWMLSPSVFYAYTARGYYVNSNGDWDYDGVGSTRGVRPSISLRSNIEYSAGDGSANNPYVIVTNS